jgi:four helix bundle protein
MQNVSPKQKYKEEFAERLIQFPLKSVRFCAEIRNDRLLVPLADQLIRSSTSIGANVMEGRGSASTKDYARFFEIALKSANETKYWLILLKELVVSHEVEGLLQEVDEIARIIAASLLTMRGKR